MSADWRRWGLAAAVLLSVCGIGLFLYKGIVTLLIVGIAALVTVLLERSYGTLVRAPRGGGWRPTDERFVDPETGKLVTVWFDPASGERRYVADGESIGPG
ncbi:MAG TPA: hypothetical protein VFP57_08955 [Sphingomicrobium sp.]|jgi:hypothetical protein|nr:hypothetical protein [Sphingomicrobium sp.]